MKNEAGDVFNTETLSTAKAVHAPKIRSDIQVVEEETWNVCVVFRGVCAYV